MNQKELEESFSKQNIDPKEWLRNHVNLQQESILELNLTDLSFNLNLLQHSLESKLLSSQQNLQQSLNTIQELPKIKETYEELDQLIQNQNKNNQNGAKVIDVGQQNQLQKIGDTLEHLNVSLDLLQKILSIDFHKKELEENLKSKKFKEAQKIVGEIEEPLSILLKLSVFDQRREEAEKIVAIIKNSELESIFKKEEQEIEKDESIQELLKKFDASKEKIQFQNN